MMCFLKSIFWRFLRKPKVGDVYIHMDDCPFKEYDLQYTVLEIRGNYVKLAYHFIGEKDHGSTTVRDMATVIAFYTKLESVYKNERI